MEVGGGLKLPLSSLSSPSCCGCSKHKHVFSSTFASNLTSFSKILTGVQSSFTPSSNRHCSLVPCSTLKTQIMCEVTEYSPPILFFKLEET